MKGINQSGNSTQRNMSVMTKEEFVAYWTTPDDSGRSALDDFEEHIAEFESENAGEVARYGDSGPGSAVRLGEMKAKHTKVVARLRVFAG